jgi:hypothetical protein
MQKIATSLTQDPLERVTVYFLGLVQYSTSYRSKKNIITVLKQQDSKIILKIIQALDTLQLVLI